MIQVTFSLVTSGAYDHQYFDNTRNFEVFLFFYDKDVDIKKQKNSRKKNGGTFQRPVAPRASFSSVIREPSTEFPSVLA
jgi:hypothetical protein